MIPGLAYLTTAFFLVIFGTSNGRSLLKNHSLRIIREGVMFIPYPLRRFVLRTLFAIPLPLARLLLDIASRPQGKELQWIHRLQKDEELVANWIGPGLARQSLGSIESTAADMDIVVIFIHGGGFTVGNSTMYMPSFILILNRMRQKFGLNARILSVEYPLSPHAPYPKAQEACLEAYRYVIHDLGVSPTKVVLMGDSAGGNLVSTTLLMLRNQRVQRRDNLLPPLPSPSGAVLISPWVKLDSGSPSYQSNHGYDVITPWQIERYVACYFAGKTDKEKDTLLHDPLVSPLYASFLDVPCPVLVTISDRELFQYDVLQFIERLRQDKIKVDTLSRPDEAHNWAVEPTFASSRAVWQEDLTKMTDWIVNRHSTGK